MATRTWLPPLLASPFRLQAIPILQPSLDRRCLRYQAFDSDLDADELQEARDWYRNFDGHSLPKGKTEFARSSGPGGQHVNKTESKAITSWAIKDLLATLPKMLHPGVRASKYYASRSDSLTFQAQTHRHRQANVDENLSKLVGEVKRIYHERVPNESRPDKQKKHVAIEKSFHRARLQQKKQQSSKKAARRGSAD